MNLFFSFQVSPQHQSEVFTSSILHLCQVGIVLVGTLYSTATQEQHVVMLCTSNAQNRRAAAFRIVDHLPVSTTGR